jgi:hypothetical protein
MTTLIGSFCEDTMTTRNPVRKRTRAKALTDPKPNFVSLVKAGANMTPFLSVKTAEPVEGDDTMHVAQKSADHGIAFIKFQKTTFKAEADVAAWLDAGGYSDYTIKDADGCFMVKGEEGLDETSANGVEADGVVIYVSKRVVETEKAEPEVQAAEDAEAASAVVVAVKEEAEAEADVNPVAKSEARDPVAELVSKGMHEPSKKDAYTMSWLGDIATSVAALYYNADYIGVSEKGAASLKIAGEALLVALADISAETIAELGAMFVAEDTADAAEKADETVAEEAAAEVTAEEPVVEAAAEEVSEISALKALVADLANTVKTLVTEKSASEEPVIPLGETRQTKKSADVEVEQTEEQTAKEDADGEYLRKRTFRAVMGI